MVVEEWARVRPATPLRPYVAWYSGYRQHGVPPATHRGLPSPYLTVIFTLDEPLHIARHVDETRAPGSYEAMVGGLHTSPAIVVHDGRQSGIQLALSPLGARALLGLPAGALAGVDGEATGVLGRRADEIRDRLCAAPTWAQRFDILDRMLLDAAALDAGPAAEVARAWQVLLHTGGRVRVADLARDTGWSARHLTNRFVTEIGLTPKAAARVIRFDRARRRLAACTGEGTADVAAEAGYYDQPHLVREFRALAGCTPSQWLAEEFRNVQAGLWDAPAESRA